ncbi:MAG: hypothetical protein AB7J19_14780 [Beijerinckiaceae bacterium]
MSGSNFGGVSAYQSACVLPVLPAVDPNTKLVACHAGEEGAVQLEQLLTFINANNSDVVLKVTLAAAQAVYASTAAALSNGVATFENIVKGAGGTDGTYPLALTGGCGTDAAGIFVVHGGQVVEIITTGHGKNYTSAPAVSFAACPGLAGASADAIIAINQGPGTFFVVEDALYSKKYQNVAGVATLISAEAKFVYDSLPPSWYLGGIDAMDLPLPTPANAGSLAFVKSGRKVNDGFFVGTGERVISDGLEWTPLLRDDPLPSLELDFASAKHLPKATGKQITFSRAGHATVIDETGKINFPPNNLVSYSNDLTNGAWSKLGLTAPQSNKLLESSGTTNKYLQRSFVAATAGRYTYQFKVKRDGIDVIYVSTSQASVTDNWTLVRFDLVSGAFVDTQSGATAAAGPVLVDHSIEPTDQDGEFLVSVTFDYQAATNWLYIGLLNTLGAITIANFGIVSYSGNGTNGVLIRDIQLERVTHNTAPRAFNPTEGSAYYGPRFDHDPLTLECKGILIEGARTNYYQRSVDATYWASSQGGTGSAAVKTVKFATAPNGKTEAAKVLLNLNGGTTSSDFSTIYVTATGLTAAVTYASSIWIKAAAPGEVGKTVIIRGVDAGSYSPVTLTDTWQRVQVAKVASGTSGSFSLELRNGVGVAGLPDTAEFLLWHPQIENGAAASSEIFTDGAAVTRPAETLLLTTGNFTPWFNPLEGTLLIRGALDSGAHPAAESWIAIFSDGTSSNYMATYSSPGFLRGLRAKTAANDVVITVASVAYNVSEFRIAFAYKENDFAAVINGGDLQTDVVGGVPVVDRINIGGYITANQMYGHIKHLAYFPTRKQNAELLELTA